MEKLYTKKFNTVEIMNRVLVCKREDPYCIDTLEIVNHPRVGEFVEVEQEKEDEDGTWLCLVGYDSMFDANCFREINMNDIEALKKVESLTER